MRTTSSLCRPITTVGIILSTLSFLPSTVKAATITSISLGAETSVAPSTTVNNVTYQGYSRSIASFTVGAAIWDPTPSSSTTLIFKRSNAAPATASNNRQIVWERCESATNCPTTGAQTVRGTLPTTTQAALAQNNIYLGTDNLFTNTGNGTAAQGNNSDVERVDFVFSGSYLANSNTAVTVFERGVTTAHDAFAIAAITGFDSSNNPTYGSLLGFTNGSWGTTDLLTSSDYLTASILNNASGQFARTGGNSQNIGGELILLTQLASENTPVYGYSLFAYDTYAAVLVNNCSIAQLSDIANTSCYNYSTGDTGGGAAANGGGIDLLAANLGVSALRGTTPVQQVPEPLSIVGTLVGGIGAFVAKKKLKQNK
jgi:hypothetical protein